MTEPAVPRPAVTEPAPWAAAGSVEGMHEASDGDSHPTGAEGAPSHEADSVASIEALPLAERAPRYQAIADRLRTELERSDPARGDA